MTYSVHVEWTLQFCHEVIYGTREDLISDELMADLTTVLKTTYEIDNNEDNEPVLITNCYTNY